MATAEGETNETRFVYTVQKNIRAINRGLSSFTLVTKYLGRLHHSHVTTQAGIIRYCKVLVGGKSLRLELLLLLLLLLLLRKFSRAAFLFSHRFCRLSLHACLRGAARRRHIYLIARKIFLFVCGVCVHVKIYRFHRRRRHIREAANSWWWKVTASALGHISFQNFSVCLWRWVYSNIYSEDKQFHFRSTTVAAAIQVATQK